MKFIDYTHHVGNEYGDVLFGYTKRTGGRSSYPSGSFNMALYIGDDEANVHHHQDRLGASAGFPPERWVMPIQKHGGNIEEVTLADAGTNVRELSDQLYDVDGLYTYDPGIMLAMNYADCVPIYIWSRSNDFTALVHAGWRGTSHGIIGRMIERYEGDPKDLTVVIGVAINGPCYTVDARIIQALEDTGLPEGAVDAHKEGFDLDLKAVNRHQALNAGVDARHIHVSALGTEDLDRFFSYRLEKGETGRALAFIGRKKDNDKG
ncbi:polyphenol oxidase family protein [Salinicoccus roseus]|uniref:polyphenol oxidase family protein n=1 Tax=Salinicoccus roseus TaxID=45670 RepID=UPI0035689DB4